jgi:hypothetical protein
MAIPRSIVDFAGTPLGTSSSSHSLDAPTVHLIECVDRPLGRVRSRWSNPSVINPYESVTTQSGLSAAAPGESRLGEAVMDAEVANCSASKHGPG